MSASSSVSSSVATQSYAVPPTTTGSANTNGDGLEPWEWFLIALGVLVVILIIVGILLFVWKKYQAAKMADSYFVDADI